VACIIGAGPAGLACNGRGHFIYPQQELVGDWAEQLLAAGGDIRFGLEATVVEQGEAGAAVRAVAVSTGAEVTLDCDLVA
jgi:p-hydroxybenzoate 3-monooxygenase